MKGFQHSYFSYGFTLAPLERSMFRLKKLLPSGWGPTLYSKHTQHLHLPIKRRRPWEKPLWWGNTSPQGRWRARMWPRWNHAHSESHMTSGRSTEIHLLKITNIKPTGWMCSAENYQWIRGNSQKVFNIQKGHKIFFFFKNPIQIKQQKNNKSAVLECHSCAGPRVSDVCGV